VTALVALGATLAVSSLREDSATFDEPAHLVAGFSYLKTGDFRLVPDHSPLARAWLALPAWIGGVAFDPDREAWRRGDFWAVGREWLFLQNEPDRLLVPARLMSVLLLLALNLAVYGAARACFGPRAGLLALACATLDPGLLAHGRLVTTDIPLGLGLLGGLFVLARALARFEAGRVGACVSVWALLPLTKMSGVVGLPAAGAMALLFAFGAGRGLRARRTAQAALLALLVAGAAVLAIWGAYGWRYSIFGAGADGAAVLLPREVGPPPSGMAEVWERVLVDAGGQPLPGPVIGFVRFARPRRLLPETYLYGLAYMQNSLQFRNSYFRGRTTREGSALYFPAVFATKTPLALMVLTLAGLARLGREWRRASEEGRLLLCGLVVLCGSAMISAVLSPLNLGHRHILPLEPALLVLAGAAAGWAPASSRRGRAGLAAVLAWLLATTLAAHPHYLSYFNETIGGPGRAHAWFADSNLDWGQDLKRLAAFQAEHPGEPLHLAYFGSAIPAAYGVEARALPSFFDFGEPSDLGPGTYVASVTQLLGVYEPLAREDFWSRPETREDYRTLLAAASEDPALRVTAWRARGARLLQQLRRRRPDARIGWSLLVYRLQADEIDRLTAAPSEP
jgi:4-amino-4-deoxy-L-arabinose transferase-like glycosyltransferase